LPVNPALMMGKGETMTHEKEYLSQEDSEAIMGAVNQALRQFFDVVRANKAACPVKIEIIGGNGSIIVGTLLSAEEDAVFGKPSSDEMCFPLSFVATDATGRKVGVAKLDQPTPVTN
jgi:hypothetical protein